MSALLEAVRAEREQLLAPIADKLAALDEIERLAGSLNGNGAAAKVAAPQGPAKPKAAKKKALPPKAPATRSGVDGLSPKTTAILTAIRSKRGEWMAPAEIAQIAGLDPHGLKNYMPTLVERGLVEKKGETVARRYRAVPDENGARERTTFGQGQVLGKPAKQTGSLQGRIIEAVGYQPANAKELATKLSASVDEVSRECDKLRKDGEIALRDDWRYRAV